MKTYAFIDASNLFYGGKKSLGWSIDYEKLLKYLRDKYSVEKVYYFGGIETRGYNFDYLKNDSVDIVEIRKYFENKLINTNDVDVKNKISKYLKQANFYSLLKKFGYDLFIKPVKLYVSDDGVTQIMKANCDVDLAFYLMRDKDKFERSIVLSGDGDFLPVLKYLRHDLKKEIVILSRRERTAKEIRRFAGENFRDFEYLKNRLNLE